MPRALLASEGGNGRGHVVTLRTVAEAIGDRFALDASLCRMEHADELRPHCDLVFQGATLKGDFPHRLAPGAPRTATWGEFMGDMGFNDEAFLSEQIGWWREVIRARRIDLVVAEFAPCALIAARSLGVPSAVIGIGYSCPPPHLPEFPVYLPEFSTRIYDERALVATVNRAAAPFGAPEIDRLPAVYVATRQIARTVPLLDPYDGHRVVSLIAPVADLPTVSPGDGEEIFVYFSTVESTKPALVEAIENLGAPTRVFMPGMDAALAGRLAGRGVVVERSAVPVGEIARRSRMVLNAGQHGTMCLCLGAGLPQVCAPQQLEQLFNARRAEGAGVARAVVRDAQNSVETIRAAVRSVYEDDGMQVRARALAVELRPMLARDPRAEIRRRILTL